MGFQTVSFCIFKHIADHTYFFVPVAKIFSVVCFLWKINIKSCCIFSISDNSRIFPILYNVIFLDFLTILITQSCILA